jgi:hypothetical protein
MSNGRENLKTKQNEATNGLLLRIEENKEKKTRF